MVVSKIRPRFLDLVRKNPRHREVEANKKAEYSFGLARRIIGLGSTITALASALYAGFVEVADKPVVFLGKLYSQTDVHQVAGAIVAAASLIVVALCVKLKLPAQYIVDGIGSKAPESVSPAPAAPGKVEAKPGDDLSPSPAAAPAVPAPRAADIASAETRLSKEPPKTPDAPAPAALTKGQAASLLQGVIGIYAIRTPEARKDKIKLIIQENPGLSLDQRTSLESLLKEAEDELADAGANRQQATHLLKQASEILTIGKIDIVEEEKLVSGLPDWDQVVMRELTEEQAAKKPSRLPLSPEMVIDMMTKIALDINLEPKIRIHKLAQLIGVTPLERRDELKKLIQDNLDCIRVQAEFDGNKVSNLISRATAIMKLSDVPSRATALLKAMPQTPAPVLVGLKPLPAPAIGEPASRPTVVSTPLNIFISEIKDPKLKQKLISVRDTGTKAALLKLLESGQYDGINDNQLGVVLNLMDEE